MHPDRWSIEANRQIPKYKLLNKHFEVSANDDYDFLISLLNRVYLELIVDIVLGLWIHKYVGLLTDVGFVTSRSVN